jgi:hypothetical protein
MWKYQVLALLLMAVIPAAAQDELPSWCPLEDSEPAETAGRLRIAFAENGNLYVMDEGAERVTLVETGDVVAVRLSSDGQVIAFTRDLGGVDGERARRIELWAINADGTSERRLISAEEFGEMQTFSEFPAVVTLGQVDFLPHTHTLVFNTSVVPTGDGIYIDVAGDLWTVDADSGEVVQRLAMGAGGEFNIAPNGQYITVTRPDSLDIVDTSDYSRRADVLEAYAAIGFGEYYAFPQIVWMADGQSFLTGVLTGDDPYSQSAGSVTVYSVSVDGTTAELGTFNAFYPSLYISPDGQFVAYWRTTSEGNDIRQLYIAAVDGSEEWLFHQIELLDVYRWLPDSQHFLFRSWSSGFWELGDICGARGEFSDIAHRDLWVTWVDSTHFLATNGLNDLYLGSVGGTSEIIAREIASYDFTVMP